MLNAAHFTPRWIADKMASLLIQDEYKGRLLEPAFGEGVLILSLLSFINEKYGINSMREFAKNIVACEKDKEIFKKGKANIENFLNNLDSLDYFPTLINDDFIEFEDREGFEMIIGNPPYLKMGSKDLYLIFFEKCFSLLKDNGRMVFITPRSWLYNNSAKSLRRTFIETQSLVEIIDFEHFKLFKQAQVYCTITLLEKNRRNSFCYKRGEDTIEYKYNEMDKNVAINNLYVSLVAKSTNTTKDKDFKTIVGFQTGANKVFINSFSHNIKKEGLVRDCIKSSGIIKKEMLFPYKRNEENKYTIIPVDEMKKDYPNTYKYLSKHRSLLEGKDRKSVFYEYARTQGFSMLDCEKVVIKTYIDKNNPVFEYTKLDKDSLVLGYAILGDVEKIKSKLESEEVQSFLIKTSNAIGNGYATISKKNIEMALSLSWQSFFLNTGRQLEN